MGLEGLAGDVVGQGLMVVGWQMECDVPVFAHGIRMLADPDVIGGCLMAAKPFAQVFDEAVDAVGRGKGTKGVNVIGAEEAAPADGQKGVQRKTLRSGGAGCGKKAGLRADGEGRGDPEGPQAGRIRRKIAGALL